MIDGERRNWVSGVTFPEAAILLEFQPALSRAKRFMNLKPHVSR
jgi:hypothetical protein